MIEPNVPCAGTGQCSFSLSGLVSEKIAHYVIEK
jgi:hypothetical protein